VRRSRIAYKAPRLESGPGILPGMGDLMGWVLGAFLVFVIYTGANQLWSIWKPVEREFEHGVKSLTNVLSFDSSNKEKSSWNNAQAKKSSTDSFLAGEDLTPEKMQEYKKYLENSASELRQ
jgi:hypothetical protein